MGPMTAMDDLLDAYRADRTSRRKLEGEAYSAALVDNVRRTFATMERLTDEVAKALAPTGYSIRLGAAVTDRSAYMRVDRTSEGFLDYLRSWSQVRTDQPPLGLHWEAAIQVTDHRGTSAELGLGVTVERPTGDDSADVAFVEFWTTGEGMQLPSESKQFQRAVVNSLLRLEDKGTLRSRQTRR